MEFRDVVLAERRKIWELLRKAQPELVAKYELVERALEAIEDDPQKAASATLAIAGEFSNIKIIDAIKVVLTRAKRSMSISELTDVLVRGGAGSAGTRENPEWAIKQSLSYHRSSGALVFDGDKVSLASIELE